MSNTERKTLALLLAFLASLWIGCTAVRAESIGTVLDAELAEQQRNTETRITEVERQARAEIADARSSADGKIKAQTEAIEAIKAENAALAAKLAKLEAQLNPPTTQPTVQGDLAYTTFAGIANSPFLFTADPSIPWTMRGAYDFGDGSKVPAEGYSAMHVYREPGTYTATLTTDDGKQWRSTVTVKPDTRTTVFVSQAGGFDGSAPDKPMRWSQVPMRDRRIVLVGQFKLASPLKMGDAVNVYVTGQPDTLLTATVKDGACLELWHGAKGVVIDGLRFEGTPGVEYVNAIWPRGSHVAILNCTFTNLHQAFMANTVIQGFQFEGNKATPGTVKGLGWVGNENGISHDVCLYGNDFDLWGAPNEAGVWAANNGFRAGYVNRLAFGGNRLLWSKDRWGLGLFRFEGGFSAAGEFAGRAWINSNEFDGGTVGVGPLHSGDSKHPEERTQYVVAINNIFRQSWRKGLKFEISRGTDGVRFVANTLLDGHIGLSIKAESSDLAKRPVTDVEVVE